MKRMITIFSFLFFILLPTTVLADEIFDPIDLTAGTSAHLLKIISEPIVETEEIEIVGASYGEETEVVKKAEKTVDVSSDYIYSAKKFKRLGVVYYGGYKYTYYSDYVLPGGGLRIPGRHNDENGYICDVDGYICGASQMHQKGTVLNSPFGKKVKIYDWCDIRSIDIYVHWK